MSDSGNPEEPATVPREGSKDKDMVSVESDEEMKNKDETEETEREMEAEESCVKDNIDQQNDVDKKREDGSSKINGILTNGKR